jgi:hypothetical protein
MSQLNSLLTELKSPPRKEGIRISSELLGEIRPLINLSLSLSLSLSLCLSLSLPCWGLNSGIHLQPFHQLFFVMGFWREGLTNYLPRLALNLDPPDLCLLSN